MRVLALGACLILGGCLSATEAAYVPPDLATPAAYSAPGAARLTEPWWQGYGDARLNALVRSALADNLDIAAAEARLAEARALTRVAEAAGGPSLDASAEAGVDRQFTGTLARNAKRTEGSAEAGLLFGWIPDLFGGQAAGVEAAEAEARRQGLLRDDLARQVVADVVRAHLETARDHTRLALIDASLGLQEQTLALVRERFAAGLASRLDVTRAEAQVAATRARRGPLGRDIANARSALSILTGQMPDRLPASEVPPIPNHEGALAIGLPRDLLRARPDVQAAEAALAGATAEIGVARADLYPQLSIPGSLTLGLTGLGTGDVVDRIVGSLAAALDIPLFDNGGRRARVDAAKARAQEALLTYRATLLRAVNDVEATLGALAAARAQRDDLQAAVEASAAAFAQAQNLYAQGLLGFLDVLDAERTLLDNRQNLAQVQADVALLTADLFTAVGAPVS